MTSSSSAAPPPQPPSESDAPPAPPAPPAARPSRRGWLDAWSVVYALLPLPMAITFSGVRDYRRGRANAEPLFIDMVALLAVAQAAPGVFVSLQTGG